MPISDSILPWDEGNVFLGKKVSTGKCPGRCNDIFPFYLRIDCLPFSLRRLRYQYKSTRPDLQQNLWNYMRPFYSCVLPGAGLEILGLFNFQSCPATTQHPKSRVIRDRCLQLTAERFRDLDGPFPHFVWSLGLLGVSGHKLAEISRH